jgi:uncharacterized protein YbjT (DUF2867 family)
MARNGTILIAGADTRHGRAYARALAVGDYRVQALVAEAGWERPGQGHASQGVALPDVSRPARRRPAGTEFVTVDPGDAKAARRALRDVAAVVIALDGRGAEGRTLEERVARALFEAAAAERVAVLYSSLLHADRQTGVPSLDLKGRLEIAARRSGATVTVLRPGALMDVFDEPGLREQVTSAGVLASGIGVDVPVSYLATDDLGLCGLLALEVPGLRGATLGLGGPVPVTFRDLIPQLWRMTGHSVTYERRDGEGVRTRPGDDEARLVRHINRDGYAVDMRPLLARLPVRLTTLEEHLAARGWATESWAAAPAERAAA